VFFVLKILMKECGKKLKSAGKNKANQKGFLFGKLLM